MAEASPKPSDDRRIRLIRAVRGACKRNGIDDDTRKAIQTEFIGKASLSDMTLAEMRRLLDKLNGGAARAAMDHRPHIGKAKALWWSLFWLGAIDDPSDAAINAFVRRQTGMSALRFLDHRKAASVIEALKAWADRAGVVWPTAEQTAEIEQIAPGFTSALHDRHAVLEAIGRVLGRNGIEIAEVHLYCRAAMGLPTRLWDWDARELDDAIKLLGRKLRRALGK
ncbi:MAG TPA: regulatory protein GemA [Sphingobium sp.]